MKRFEAGRFGNQFFIIPAFGIIKYHRCNNIHYAFTFAWFKRGFHIVIFTKKIEQEQEDEK